jgi:hypothetical protein
VSDKTHTQPVPTPALTESQAKQYAHWLHFNGFTGIEVRSRYPFSSATVFAKHALFHRHGGRVVINGNEDFVAVRETLVAQQRALDSLPLLPEPEPEPEPVIRFRKIKDRAYNVNAYRVEIDGVYRFDVRKARDGDWSHSAEWATYRPGFDWSVPSYKWDHNHLRSFNLTFSYTRDLAAKKAIRKLDQEVKV